METLKLEALTKEQIEELDLSLHDLWLIKNGNTITGPYHGDELKNYAALHQIEFEHSLASKADQAEWREFFAHALFADLAPTEVKEVDTSYQGPFWILEQGLKSRALSKTEILKRIEMGLLTFTDSISTNDGHEWQKIFQTPGFEQRSHSATDLPIAPSEFSFHKSSSETEEQLEAHKPDKISSPKEGLASLTYLSQHQNQTNQLKVDEITLETVQETEISKSMKWAIPSALAIASLVIMGARFAMNPTIPGHELSEAEEIKESPLSILPRDLRPHESTPARTPASVRKMDLNSRSGITRPVSQHDSQYPTHMEIHQNDPIERDPLQDQMDQMESDRAPAQEQSIVGNQNGESLDAAMNPDMQTPEVAPEPVVEESSDF